MELRLPPEYQEVEYIENTGTQYIETNFIPTMDATVSVEWDFMLTVVQNGDQMMFGARNGTKQSVQGEFYDHKKWYVRVATKGYTAISDTLSIGTKYSAKCDNEHFRVNNKELSPTEDNNTGTLVPLYIFAWNYKQASSNKYINKGLRMYKLIFKNGNTETANFVPCYRKSDGEIGMYDTVTKTFYTNSGTGTFLKGADVTRYIDNVSVLDTRRKIMLNTPHIDTSVGDLVTFNTDLSAPLKSCKVSFLPIQEGEGDPSPDNERPISGFTGCEVQRTGKNLVNSDECLIGKYINRSGAKLSAVDWTLADYIACKPNTTYTITGSTVQSNTPSAQLAFCDKEKNLIELRPAGKSNLTFTTPDGCAFMRLSIRNANVDEIQVEVGDTATDYEPYIGQTYPITFPTEAGTVYGGYVDLVSGELVATHLAFVMDGVNHKVSTGAAVNTNNNMARGHAFMGRAGGLENVPLGKNNSGLYAINKYVIHGMENGAGNTAVEGIYCGTGTPYVRVVVSADDLADVSGANAIINSINEWLTNNPVQVCYTLADPIHYQLTSQQILTLKGTNNVYSDTNGQTEIKYWKH